MESIVKLGEVQFEMTGDVKTTEELKVLLRWGWGAEITNKMAFNPAEELKTGDGIKVTIEKVTIIPDPVEEEVEETGVEAEQGVAGEAGNVSETGEAVVPESVEEAGVEAKQGVVCESGNVNETEEAVVPAAECECSCISECKEETGKTEVETAVEADTKISTETVDDTKAV